jgi:hypothetical protein
MYSTSLNMIDIGRSFLVGAIIREGNNTIVNQHTTVVWHNREQLMRNQINQLEERSSHRL